MSPQSNSNAFFSAPLAYDDFMGRYARPLARQFAKSIPLEQGSKLLDLGCGPGALTGELVALVGAENVSVVDPSQPFLEACIAKYPDIDGKVGRAEELPFAEDSFDAVLSQLVLHFIGDLEQAGREIMRVIKPGGRVSMCTWIINRMELFSHLDRAAQAANSSPDTAVRVKRFDEEGAVASYLESMGLVDVTETTYTVQTDYADFDELWRTYLGGVGPMGPWLLQQTDDMKTAVRSELFRLLGEPAGKLTVTGIARSACGIAP